MRGRTDFARCGLLLGVLVIIVCLNVGHNSVTAVFSLVSAAIISASYGVILAERFKGRRK